MKKMITICFLICILFLTGCQKNKLVCTQKDDSIDDLKSETKYTFTFNEETVKKVTMTTEVTLSGDYNDETFIENYKSSATEAADEYNEAKGVSATVSNKKNVVTLKVEMDSTKMSKEDVEAYGLDLTKDELKTEFENIGYTCK